MSKMLKIFKCRRQHIVYIASDGEHCVFRPRTPGGGIGYYLTKVPAKIEELTKIAGQDHPFIYIDPEESEIDENLADPIVAQRAAIADEERKRLINMLGDPNQLRGAGIDPEALAKLMGMQKDFGDTGVRSELQGIGNSTSMQATSAESNAGGLSNPAAVSNPVAKVQKA